MRFLDTNIILRYLTRDDEDKARRALALMLRLERGEERVATSPMVIFEAVFTLEKTYGVPRAAIRQRVGDIISFRGVFLPRKDMYRDALDLYASTTLSFADAFNAAFAKRYGVAEIYSWDRDFDRVAGLIRIEPAEA